MSKITHKNHQYIFQFDTTIGLENKTRSLECVNITVNYQIKQLINYVITVWEEEHQNYILETKILLPKSDPGIHRLIRINRIKSWHPVAPWNLSVGAI